MCLEIVQSNPLSSATKSTGKGNDPPTQNESRYAALAGNETLKDGFGVSDSSFSDKTIGRLS